jgi:hypothetical protein
VAPYRSPAVSGPQTDAFAPTLAAHDRLAVVLNTVAFVPTAWRVFANGATRGVPTLSLEHACLESVRLSIVNPSSHCACRRWRESPVSG